MDIIANNITSNKLEAANVTINSKDVYTWFSEKISSVTDLTATVKNLEKDLETAQTKLENVTNKVETVETSVSKNTTDIEASNTSIADVSSKVITNTESISSLNTSLTTVSDKVDEHTQSISDLTSGLQETNGKVTANEGEISTIKTNIADINDDITNISTDLINVSTYCNSLKDKITAINNELDGYVYIDPVKTYQNTIECSGDKYGWFIAFKPSYLGIEPGGYISKLYIRSVLSSNDAKSKVSFKLDWWISPAQADQGTIDTSKTTLDITETNAVYGFDFEGKAPILSADDYVYRLVPLFNGVSNKQIHLAMQQMQKADSYQLTLGSAKLSVDQESGFVPAISVEFYNPVKQDDTSLQLFKRFFKKLQ